MQIACNWWNEFTRNDPAEFNFELWIYRLSFFYIHVKNKFIYFLIVIIKQDTIKYKNN